MKQLKNLSLIKKRALNALGAVKPANEKTQAPKGFLFEAKRTSAGRDLPPYYSVYFLLHDLLDFKDLGQFEKVSWSIPIDFKGRAFLIEHRKLGLGLFAQDLEQDEEDAKEIVKLITSAVKEAQPYFTWIAKQAVQESKININNNCLKLFGRYKYLMSLHEKEKKEAIDRNDEVHKRVEKTQHGTITSYNWPSRQLHQNANWLAISTIEAFFSWTEHLFVLIAIIKGEVSDGSSILDLANSNWHTKFSCALDTKKPAAKKYHDELTIVRRQIRNFVAHGAIGKDCQTFEFHSSVGAVPVSVFYQDNKPKESVRNSVS